ncbi:exonuclease [Mycobacterium phage EniyanLRS]|uniref:Exonuclease n=1 Tax=Mycobacterium phage EniyanLRS TaxID=1933770 RepID=A0A2I2MPG4_9CAUD|nr:exonuclease [Mycobacterium phage EniyanLRS]
MTDYNIPREDNKWRRPLLYPPNGDKRVAYSRPSTLAKDIDSKDGLIPWEQTMVAMGLAKSKYLYNRVQGILARGGSWDTDKAEFKSIMEDAKNAAQWKAQADRGTSIHDLTDAAERGILDWRYVDDDLKPVIESYMEDIVPHFTYLATECFVAIDKPIEIPGKRKSVLRAAGSVDRVCEFDGKRYIVDVKSGRDDMFRTSVCGQLYLYSRGWLYRDDLVHANSEITWADWRYDGVNPSARAELGVEQDRAIMLQAPKVPDRDGTWRWKTFWIPLDRGEQVIMAGQYMRKARYIPEFKRVEF